MATDTSKYRLNHSMIRVKDPQKSVKFYEFLGMKVIDVMKNPDAKFDLYFLAFDSPGAVSQGVDRSDREGLIELTHNYGTENDPEYKTVNGNTEPYRGFGHVAISVDNIQAACKRIEDEGYRFKKKLTEGTMRNIAFVLDPDDYWVELIVQKPLEATENATTTDVTTYRMNHTMLRCKDSKKTLDFYQNIMGMTLINTSESKAGGFTNYFLAYPPAYKVPSPDTPHHNAHREGLLEITWNHGTENDPNFSYHDSNKQPQGFGHICMSVDDLDAACAYLEEKKVNWKKRLTDGRMKNIAFVLDPDGYWIEIIQNQTIKARP